MARLGLTSAFLSLVLLAAVIAISPARAADYGGAPPPGAVEPQGIPMFIGPGYHYQVVALIPYGAQPRFVLCEYKGPWCQVAFGRYNGWIDNGDFNNHFDKWYLLGH